MTRTIILTMVMMAALCAAASDRFYLENFSIAAGETRTVGILLDNEAVYTAFQADLYLPEGLTATNITLTDREDASHTLSLSNLPDGGKRLLSYSIRVKPYSENSGALVTMDITASGNWMGPATIALHNIIFTAITGAELPFADETCAVTLRNPGDVNIDGTVDVLDVTTLISKILGNPVPQFSADNADIDGDSIHDVADVTAIIAIILNAR